MIALLGGNLRSEDDRAVLAHRHILENIPSLLFGGYAPEYAEALSEGLGTRRKDLGIASVAVLGVISFLLKPEVVVYGFLK